MRGLILELGVGFPCWRSRAPRVSAHPFRSPTGPLRPGSSAEFVDRIRLAASAVARSRSFAIALRLHERHDHERNDEQADRRCKCSSDAMPAHEFGARDNTALGGPACKGSFLEIALDVERPSSGEAYPPPRGYFSRGPVHHYGSKVQLAAQLHCEAQACSTPRDCAIDALRSRRVSRCARSAASAPARGSPGAAR